MRVFLVIRLIVVRSLNELRMRHLWIGFLFCVIVLKSYSQPVSALPNTIWAVNTIEGLNDTNGLGNGEVLYGIPIPEGKVIGDTYLNKNWMISTLLLYDRDKMLEGFPLRYDILSDELEIKAKDGVKALRGDRVKSFIWLDSLTKAPTYFVNAKDYKDAENVTMMGFFQVLADGPSPLFKKTRIKIKKANYKVQFDVGSRDDKIIKKHDYFTLQNNHVAELPSGKKNLLPFFGDQAAEVEKFIEVNSLNTSKETHLKAIFEHYNLLIQH